MKNTHILICSLLLQDGHCYLLAIGCLHVSGYVLSHVLTVYLCIYLLVFNGTGYMTETYFLGFLFKLCDPKPMSSYICIWTSKAELITEVSEPCF